MKTYPFHHGYIYDSGINLRQQIFSGIQPSMKMYISQQSNRAIDALLYDVLNPTEKSHLEQTFKNKSLFDARGNQLQAGRLAKISWESNNELQSTSKGLGNGISLEEYYTYAAPGKRIKKITKTLNSNGKLVKLEQAIHLGNLEYRSTWKGTNLHFDGQIVTETYKQINKLAHPNLEYNSLRILSGHQQLAQTENYRYKNGQMTATTDTQYYLDNHIDSTQLVLNTKGTLESFTDYYPYGGIAISFHNLPTRVYGYSGQELEQSGLITYEFRYYLPANYRWMCPDPTGIQGSGLNLYAMVWGNPITFRDEFGLNVYDLRMALSTFSAFLMFASFLNNPPNDIYSKGGFFWMLAQLFLHVIMQMIMEHIIEVIAPHLYEFYKKNIRLVDMLEHRVWQLESHNHLKNTPKKIKWKKTKRLQKRKFKRNKTVDTRLRRVDLKKVINEQKRLMHEKLERRSMPVTHLILDFRDSISMMFHCNASETSTHDLTSIYSERRDRKEKLIESHNLEVGTGILELDDNNHNVVPLQNPVILTQNMVVPVRRDDYGIAANTKQREAERILKKEHNFVPDRFQRHGLSFVHEASGATIAISQHRDKLGLGAGKAVEIRKVIDKSKEY